jgi:hypothetical protein
MSFISVGLAGAGLAAQLGGSLLKGGSSGPVFNYRAADNEMQRLREQIAARDEYDRLEAEERARQRKLADQERFRQTLFTGESNQSVGNEINRYNDVPGQVDTTAKRLSDYFANNSGGMPNVMPKMAGHTADYAAGKAADAAAFNTQQNDATAKVRSFGDVWGDIARGSLDDKTHLTNVADFKQGSKSLLPAEMRPIVNRQVPQVTAGSFGNLYSQGEAPDNTFADILKGAGGIAVSAGLSGFNPFGGGVGAGGGWSTGLNGYGPAGMPRYGGPR